MSWCDLKSLTVDDKNFGVQDYVRAMCNADLVEDDKQKEADIEVVAREVFKVSFEKVLRRCGRFLTKLVIEVFKVRVDREIIDTLIKECYNLKYLDMRLQSFAYDVNDEDLIDLFTPMQKLEHLAIKISDRVNTTFLYVLPCENIKELILLKPISVPFYKICHVSIT